MGCSQSKIENEEAVARCKERKQHMKDAVAARNAFAAAHSSYAVSLKNTGAALSDFASGESLYPHPYLTHSASAPSASSPPPPLPPEPPSFGTLPPPPPPIPADMAIQTPTPLQRAQSMPELAVSKTVPNRSETIIEEEEDEEEEDEDEEDEEEVESEVHSLKRTSGRGAGARPVEEENGIRPPPVPPPPVTSNQAPPSPPPGNSPYDFFFSYDVPGGGLRVPEEVSREREDLERAVLEERASRADAESSAFQGRNTEDLPPKVLEKPPVPAQEAEGAPAGKLVSWGKEGVVGPGPGGGGEAKRAGKGMSLVQIFNKLDDFFLKASASANDVTKMLEAARLHYHSSTANNCGHINHSERVMKVITWNRSFRGLQNTDDDKNDDFDSEENETHATVLDKLLAWEKKLYDEVKAGEIMKFEYQRKFALLSKQKKRGANPETLEKTKASLSRLHTRYIVDMQSMDSTVTEINRLRDEQLYPKLTALVEGLATMWAAMQYFHSKQSKIVDDLKNVDISKCVKQTSVEHYEQTEQLWIIVQEWHNQFDRMVINQKRYIKDLNSWLKLNLVPIESSLKEKVSSPPRAQNPPIQRLLLAWNDCLEKLPEEHAKAAIFSFAGVLQTILQHQDDELKMKAKCEEARKDLARKTRSFEDWCNKYMQRRMPPDGADPDGLEDFAHDEAVIEREVIVEAAKNRLEEEEATYKKQCVQVREKTLTTLRTRLPELFWSLFDFARECSQMYNELKSISQY